MCIAPHRLPNGTEVACRNCWQCRANRVNDLVGRCIAEQTNSAETWAVTLTYAGDGPATAMLRYRDIQLAMKSIRAKGFRVRYIVAGEFGSKKGRAHWHAVLFFQGQGPGRASDQASRRPWQILVNHRFNWEPWPHGFVFFQEPDYGGFQYVLKYALKDQADDTAKGHLAMSKKPPLGHDYFMARAAQIVEQGLAPQDLFYAFRNVLDNKGRPRRFLIQGVTRQKFLAEYERRWREVYQTEPPLSDELTAEWDRQARMQRDCEMSFDEHLKRKEQWPRYQNGRKPDGAEWMREMYWNDDDMWSIVRTSVPPMHLWRDVPDALVDTFANGEAIPLEVLDSPAGMTVYTEKGDYSWLVNDQHSHEWREWLQSLGVSPRF